MFWLIPAWTLSLIATFLLGYHYRDLTKKVEHLEKVVKSKEDRKVVEEAKSQLIDPSDEIQNAIYEHERMMKKLNP